MATTIKKTVTKTSSSSTKGMGNAKPVQVSQPTAPADYKQGSYTAAKYNGSYKPQTYTNGYKQGTYNSKYQPQIDSALDRVVNWSYDPMQDANYQALAKVYNAQGNIAAKNSLADAAALNGGYGTSYAASAAQQARNQYNQQLAAMIPELENTAYQRAQGTYNALMDADNTQYGRFRDTEQDKQWKEQHNLNVFNTNEANRYNAANFAKDVFAMNEDNRYRAASYNQNEKQFAYNALLDKYNTLNNNYQWGMNYNYQLDRDKVSDERWAMEYALAKKGSGGGSKRRSSGGGGGGYTSGDGVDLEALYKQAQEEDKKKKTTTSKWKGKTLTAQKTASPQTNNWVKMNQ